MRFLVTGCTSYIAKYLTMCLLNGDHEVVGISRSSPQIRHPLFFWHQHDLGIGPCSHIGKVDYLIHMAAQSLFGKSAGEYFRSNLLTSFHVSQMIEDVAPSAVIYTSSMEVYGHICSGRASEQTPMSDPNLYGITKYYGEKLFEEIIPTFSLRMPGVVAVGSHGWIDRTYHRLRQNEEIRLFDIPYNHVLHARDVFNFIRAVAVQAPPRKGGVYNICANGISTSREVVGQMSSFIGSISSIKIIKGNGNINYLIDNTAVNKIFHPMTITESICLYLEEMKEAGA